MVHDERTDVVTAFLEDERGALLLLKRSSDASTYPGHWAAISGYCETTDPLLQAEIELREEAGLHRSDVTLVRKGTPVAVEDRQAGQSWRVHPFRFRWANEPRALELNHEHTEYDWVFPEQLDEFDTVPCLGTALKRTRP